MTAGVLHDIFLYESSLLPYCVADTAGNVYITYRIYRNLVVVNYTCASHLLHGCKQRYTFQEKDKHYYSLF